MNREDGKEFAGDYEITQSVQIGNRRFVIGRCDSKQEPFLVANFRTKLDGLFSEYYEVGVSDDYMQILGEYIQRQQKAYAEIVQTRDARGSDGTVFSAQDCLPHPEKQDYTGCIVAMRASELAPEYRTKEDQPLYVKDGNGAKPNACGTKVYVRECWSGDEFYVRRTDIQGVLQPDKLPEWAKENVAIFKQQEEKARQHTEELEM